MALTSLLTGSLAYDREAGDEAINLLGVDDPAEREELHTQLYAFAVGFRNVAMGKIKRPRSGEIVDALRVIPEYCNKLHGAMATLLVARMTAPEGCGPNEQLRREIYPLVADTVLRFTDQQAFEWKGGFEDPLFGLFGRLARDFAPLSDLFTSDDFRETTRPDHPALVKLIGQLGDLWLRETGRVPRAHGAGGRPDYVPPFVRFVRTFAPVAGLSANMPTKKIGRLLSLSPARPIPEAQ